MLSRYPWLPFHWRRSLVFRADPVVTSVSTVTILVAPAVTTKKLVPILVSVLVLVLVLVSVLVLVLLLVFAFKSLEIVVVVVVIVGKRTFEIPSVIPRFLPFPCLAQCLLFGGRKEPDKVGIRLYLSCSQFIVPCTQTTLMQGRGAVINIKLWEIFFLGWCWHGFFGLFGSWLQDFQSGFAGWFISTCQCQHQYILQSHNGLSPTRTRRAPLISQLLQFLSNPNLLQILYQNLSSTLHCLSQASTNLSTAGICVSDPKRWWIIRDELFLEGNSSIINDISGGESRAVGSKSRSGKSTSKSSAFNDTFDLVFFQLKLEVFTCLACRDRRAIAISPRLQAKRPRWWPWPLAKGSEQPSGRGEPGKGAKELRSGTDRAMANGSLKGWCGLFGASKFSGKESDFLASFAVALKGR